MSLMRCGGQGQRVATYRSKNDVGGGGGGGGASRNDRCWTHFLHLHFVFLAHVCSVFKHSNARSVGI